MGRSAGEFAFSDWQVNRPTAGRSFLLSLTIHTAVVAAAFSINPRPSARKFPEPRVAQLLEKDSQRLLWYPPKAELPAVAPAETPQPKPNKPASKPRFRLPQTINADDPNPQSLRQMVRTDAPEVIQQDTPLPNIVSWKAPKVEMPRFEPVQPPRLAAPSTAGLPPLEAPRVEPVQTVKLDLADLQKNPELRFQREREQRQRPSQRALDAEAAPEITAQQQAALDAARFQELARLRYQGRQRDTQAPEKPSLTAEQAPKCRRRRGSRH